MTVGGTVIDRRRGLAALFLLVCGLAGITPHWLGPVRGLLPSITLALLLGGYSFRTLLAQPNRGEIQDSPKASGSPCGTPLPSVDVVVAARDEEAVIASLVDRLSQLRYPREQLKLWVVDDGSTDRTGEILDELMLRYDQLRVVRRPRDAGGGKSGALNRMLQELQGRWLLVLDADADLQTDLLERVINYAEAGGWAAVQLRKAEVNSAVNLLSRAQAMEMALDAVIQEGRLATGGVAELRGNGELLRRDAVITAGGFNEATVTDDLDLSFRLLLADLPVGVLWDPPVQEEAVLTLQALWRQRQRWAEGGLQRFFDYGPQLISDRLSVRRRVDLACFFLIQYALPQMVIADLIGAVMTSTAPMIWPFSILALGLSGVATVKGCRRPSEGPALPSMNPLDLALVMTYLTHWFVVIPWVTLRMALLPKRLIWVKTTHLGGDPAETPAGDPGCGPEDGADGEPELAAGAGNI